MPDYRKNGLMTMTTPYKKTFYLASVSVLFVFSAAMGFLLNEIYEERYNLQETPAVVEAKPEKMRSFQWQEQSALCKQYELDCEPVSLPGDAATEAMLMDLSLSELVTRYPVPDWTITENAEHVVTICRNVRGLCEQHQHVYHFGINESGQYLAVYFGPSIIGSDGGAFLVTDVLVKNLSDEQRLELENGEYEFHSQDELIAMLDNFSEL